MCLPVYSHAIYREKGGGSVVIIKGDHSHLWGMAA